MSDAVGYTKLPRPRRVSLKAIVLTAALSDDGSAQVIASTHNAILFGLSRPVKDSVQVFWYRVLLKDGSNRAIALDSWRAGHDDPPATPSSLKTLITGETPNFVVPGDFFEVDLPNFTDRRSRVRMSQDAFEALMRGLLDR